MKSQAVLLALTFVVVASGGRARAQPGPPAGDPRTQEQLRHEVAERMRSLRALKIAETLALDQATSARLFPLLARYDQRKGALQKEGRDIKRELRAESAAATPNGAKLTSAVDRLLANRGKRRALEEEKIREVRKVLTPVQQARLVLLLPRIERDYARRMRETARDDGRDVGRAGAPALR